MKKEINDYKKLYDEEELQDMNNAGFEDNKYFVNEINKLRDRREIRSHISKVFIFSVISIIVASYILKNTPETAGEVVFVLGIMICFFIKYIPR